MIKKCPVCDKVFQTDNNSVKYCSPECRDKQKRERIKVANKNRIWGETTRICPVCGLHFTTKKGAQKYCSKECAEKKSEEKYKDYNRYASDDPTKINVHPHGWLKYMVENGKMTQCPMCGEWTRSDSGFCPKHENNH
jgi:uncharacterized Zn-finger protein